MNEEDIEKVLRMLRRMAIKQAGIDCGVSGKYNLLMDIAWLENYINEYQCVSKNEVRAMRILGYLKAKEGPYKAFLS